MKIDWGRYLVVALTILFLVGCRAAAAPDSGFLKNPELLKSDEDLPFDAAWIEDKQDFRDFKTIFIAPVDTQHLEKMDWWDKASLADLSGNFSPKTEAAALASYFSDALRSQIGSGGSPLKLVDQPEPDTLVVELAIVEVVPTKVWLNSISYIVAGGVDTGTVAMEGRFRRGAEGQILAKFKDREHGQMSLVSVADLQWYSHAHHIIDDWSDQLYQMITSPPSTKISHSLSVTLRPW